MNVALKIRNKLLHAERWVRLSNHGADTVRFIVEHLRAMNDYKLRQHRIDCKTCKRIAEQAEKGSK